MTGRTARRLAIAAAAVLLAPPLRGWLEATMTTHLLLQLPLLVALGVILGRPVERRRDVLTPYNPGGIAGLLLGLALLGAAMTPRILDAAVEGWPADLAKTAALLAAGALLARSWRALGSVGQAFLLGYALFMGLVLGLVLRETPARLCATYLAGDQRAAGTGLALLAAAIGTAWLVRAFRSPAGATADDGAARPSGAREVEGRPPVAPTASSPPFPPPVPHPR